MVVCVYVFKGVAFTVKKSEGNLFFRTFAVLLGTVTVFKMVAVAVLYFYNFNFQPLTHEVGDLHCCPTFGWNRCVCFDNMQV